MDIWKRTIWVMIMLALTCLHGYGQDACGAPGKFPSKAFNICGNQPFIFKSKQICQAGQAVENVCRGMGDINPDYFRFECRKSGTWGFLLTPIRLSDYDWALLDITGKKPEDIYRDFTCCIAANWSGQVGNTGATAEGKNLFECAGPTYPPFSKMPWIDSGHTYLLMISNWIDFLTECTLDFTGGTAEIGTYGPPALKFLEGNFCGTELQVILDRMVLCTSIAPDGSDWALTDNRAQIIAARGADCGLYDQSDTIILTLSNALPPGPVSLKTKIGNDGNTVNDNCNFSLAVNKEITGLMPAHAGPLTFKSAELSGCRPEEIIVQFSGSFFCGSLAANGSDFAITGPQKINIKEVIPFKACFKDTTSSVRISFQEPILVGGQYFLKVKIGTDGNTLLNYCVQPMVESAEIAFTASDTVNADYTFSVRRGCIADTFRFVHPGGNGTNYWEWLEYGIVKGNGRIWETIYPNNQNAFEVKIGAFVSNGVCRSLKENLHSLPDERMHVVISGPELACQSDPVYFNDRSIGPVSSWYWYFGNGQTCTAQNPPAQYYHTTNYATDFSVTLSVANSIGCSQKTTHTLTVFNSCLVAVPNAFTPNGDGLNDYLYPLNGWNAKDLRFMIYDRYGQLVWKTTDWNQKWDGNIKGNPAPAGNYVWALEYFNLKTGKPVTDRGTTMLIR